MRERIPKHYWLQFLRSDGDSDRRYVHHRHEEEHGSVSWESGYNLTEVDPQLLRASVLAYRNLPSVRSDEDCYHLMVRVSTGLRSISSYLNHTIWSFEKSYVNLKVKREQRHIGRHILSDCPDACWVRILEAHSDQTRPWKQSFQNEVQVLSPLEVEGAAAYRERLPPELPDGLRSVIGAGDNRSFLGYPIAVLDYLESENLLLLSSLPNRIRERRESEFWLIHVPSTYQWRKYREAVNEFIDEPTHNLEPLLNLFERIRNASWPAVPRADIDEKDWLFLTDPDNESTEAQRLFVRRALTTPDFALLWGPPGSGKTYAIMELIYQAARRGMRVLFCASTHVAIDQALERLLANPRARKEIVPLRIGESDKISTLVREYQLENVAPSYQRKLTHDLTALPNRTESQDCWLRALTSEEGRDWVNRLLVDSANLVCGTTVGILQHPEIRYTGKQREAPLYDILIIDEASKTTFHEFLVPARFAKRWVLCGDPHQLSPYVDADSIAATVRTLLQREEERQCCLDTYRAAKQTRKPVQLLLLSNDEALRNLYARQAASKGLAVAEVSGETDLEDTDGLTDILASQVVVCDEAGGSKLSGYLPGNIEYIRGEEVKLGPEFAARRRYFERSDKLWSDDNPEWEHELAVIIGEEFFTRTTKDGTFEEFGKRKRLLIPEFLATDSDSAEDNGPSQAERFEAALNRIRLCAYPSVLELLVLGFRPEADFDSTLNRGFSPEDSRERLTKLQYQFRMHPEISRFPREFIYDSALLIDSASVNTERDWPYSRYARRALWVDVEGHCIDNENNDEAQILVDHLLDFARWGSSNPRNDGRVWEVAVLSFYSNQVDLLHHLLQTNGELAHEGASLYGMNNVQVRVGTVDSIQGREADVVFVSFVRNGHGGVGFLSSPNRLNVAITRARYQLVLIGNKRFFRDQNHSELLRNLAQLPDDTPFGGRNSE